MGCVSLTSSLKDRMESSLQRCKGKRLMSYTNPVSVSWETVKKKGTGKDPLINCSFLFQPLSRELYYYYLTQLAFYWSLMFSQFIDVKRKVRTSTPQLLSNSSATTIMILSPSLTESGCDITVISLTWLMVEHV